MGLTPAASPIEWTDEQALIFAAELAPLRIAAGAGTGKTSTIAERLRRLVQSGAVDPTRALGITFTNKAAAQLAATLVTDGRGEEPEVVTYHAFAYRLLQEFGAFIGVERDVRIITPGVVRQLMVEAIETGTDYSNLDLTARAHRVEDAAILAAQASENLIAASEIEPVVDGAADGINESRAELVGVVARYEELKARYRLLDYGDLVKLAYRLVSTMPGVRDEVRKRYDFILMDEYQDTNPAQRMLFAELFSGCAITAVGDRDQTIYEWRGASRVNFDRFETHFSGETHANSLSLTTNWRSDNAIIAAANAVRSRINDVDPGGALTPRPDAASGAVGTLWFSTATEEARWIAEELSRLHLEDGVAWSEMAVIFRKNAQIPLIRDAMSEAGIPLQVVSLGGLLNVPEVSDLYAWLRLLSDPTDGPALARILLGSTFMLSMTELKPFADALRTAQKEAPEISMLEVIFEWPDASSAPIERFRRHYRELLQAAQSSTLIDLSRRILYDLGFWIEIDAMDPTAGASARVNMYRFLDLVESWSPVEGRASLDAFVGYLSTIEEATSSQELDLADLGSADAVSLITAHRAKGLEFDVVFLPAVTHGTFPSGNRGFDDPYSSARWLPHDQRLDSEELTDVATPKTTARKDALRTRHIDQEWRTAYVAVTRARHSLLVSGAHWYPGLKKPKQASELWTVIDELPESTRLHYIEEPGDRPEQVGHHSPSVAPAPDPLFPDGWIDAVSRSMKDPGFAEGLVEDRAAYDAAMKQLRLDLQSLPEEAEVESRPPPVETSVTDLVTYAICPLKYFWSSVDRLPRRPSRALRRGVELHRRIELHNRGIVQLDVSDDDGYDIALDEPAPSKNAFAEFEKSAYGTTRPIHVETPFRLVVDGMAVRGRIDAIYQDGDDGWEIVDFKSGKPSKLPGKETQLQAYAVAAADSGVMLQLPSHMKVSFVYLGDGVIVESTPVDDEWLEDARSAITDKLTAIRAAAYEPQPSVACRSCDFLRFCPTGQAWVEENP